MNIHSSRKIYFNIEFRKKTTQHQQIDIQKYSGCEAFVYLAFITEHLFGFKTSPVECPHVVIHAENRKNQHREVD